MSEKKIIYCESMLESKEKYTEYINNHIMNVQEAYDKNIDVFKTIFPEVYKGRNVMQLYINIQNHDKSKFDENEFWYYAMRFFPVKGIDVNSEKVKKDFKIGWLHHVHNNAHHPNHWVLVDDNQIYLYDMPDIYIIEMLCDWMAMSRYYNSRTLDYWNSDSAKKLPMSEYTKSKVNEFMNAMLIKYNESTLW